MILQQKENNKQYVTMIKNNRLFFFNFREYACDFFKCVSKFVNCVSNRSNA